MDYYFDYDYTPKRKTDVDIYYQDPKELRIDDDDKQVLHDDEYKVKIQKKGDRYYIDHKELKENMIHHYEYDYKKAINRIINQYPGHRIYLEDVMIIMKRRRMLFETVEALKLIKTKFNNTSTNRNLSEFGNIIRRQINNFITFTDYSKQSILDCVTRCKSAIGCISLAIENIWSNDHLYDLYIKTNSPLFKIQQKEYIYSITSKILNCFNIDDINIPKTVMNLLSTIRSSNTTMKKYLRLLQIYQMDIYLIKSELENMLNTSLL